MLARIDPRSGEPIFAQLVFQVKRAVAQGELGDGDRLPSVRELARDLSVNPNTVVRAYDALERDGVIVRRQGAGCFVTGGKSVLDGRERRRRLDDLVNRAVTESFHLGFSPDDVRAATERGLARLERRRDGKKNARNEP